MGIFDKLSSMAKEATDKASDMIEIQKVNSKIGEEKRKISDMKEKIGEYYWEKHASGEQLEEEPTELCKGIDLAKEAIIKYEAEIKAIQGEAPSAEAQAEGVEMKACPSCGVWVPSGKKFCPQCGQNMSESQQAEQREPDSQAATKLCPSCGTPVEEGLKFCPECGQKL